MSWPLVKLGALADLTVGHVGTMANQYQDDGIPFLRSLNVKPHRIDPTDLKFVGSEFAQSLKKSSLRSGDVVTVRTGEPGQTAVVPSWLDGANCSDLVITRPGPELHPGWLSYHLNWITRSKISGHLVGAVQQHFNVSSAARLELEVPPRNYQLAIAEVLGALDDKIAANELTSTTMDRVIRSEYSALNGDCVPLGSLATNIREQIKPENMARSGPYLGLEHLPREHFWVADQGSASEVTSAKARFEEGDVLFGKLRPYFHKVVTAPFGGVCSTDILVVRAIDSAFAGLILAAVGSKETVAAAVSSSEGTRMPRTSWNDLSGTSVRWPGRNAALSFSIEVQNQAKMAANLGVESQSLARTRDELVPLLMSGKITVKSAEKVVSDAV